MQGCYVYINILLFVCCRVGRTARAGKAGRSLSFVTQYDVEPLLRLEALIGYKLPEVLLSFTLLYFASHRVQYVEYLR